MRIYFIPRSRDSRLERLVDTLGLYHLAGLFGGHSPGARTRSSFGGSLVVHLVVFALLFWLWPKPLILPSLPPSINVSLAPNSPPAPQGEVAPPETAASSVASATPAPTRTPRRPQTERPVITTPGPSSGPAFPPLPAPQPQPPVPNADDMMAHVAAAQARRHAEEDLERQLEARDNTNESAQQRGQRLAAANVKASLNLYHSTGGEFAIRSVGIHDAEFTFHGWNQDFHREGGQTIAVNQGSEKSIELAVVKRIIEIIRAREPGDFYWTSHRLAREVKLSARPEDQAGLEDFLMAEFAQSFQRAPAG